MSKNVGGNNIIVDISLGLPPSFVDSYSPAELSVMVPHPITSKGQVTQARQSESPLGFIYGVKFFLWNCEARKT